MLHSRILCQIIVFCASFKNYQERKEEITRTWTESVSSTALWATSMFFILLKALLSTAWTDEIWVHQQHPSRSTVLAWMMSPMGCASSGLGQNCRDQKKKGPQNQSWTTCVIKYWTTQYVVSHNHLLCQEEGLDQRDTDTRLSKWNCCLLQKKTIKGGYSYCPPPSPGSHYH